VVVVVCFLFVCLFVVFFFLHVFAYVNAGFIKAKFFFFKS